MPRQKGGKGRGGGVIKGTWPTGRRPEVIARRCPGSAKSQEWQQPLCGSSQPPSSSACLPPACLPACLCLLSALPCPRRQGYVACLLPRRGVRQWQPPCLPPLPAVRYCSPSCPCALCEMARAVLLFATVVPASSAQGASCALCPVQVCCPSVEEVERGGAMCREAGQKQEC